MGCKRSRVSPRGQHRPAPSSRTTTTDDANRRRRRSFCNHLHLLDIPPRERVKALRGANIVLLGTATNNLERRSSHPASHSLDAGYRTTLKSDARIASPRSPAMSPQRRARFPDCLRSGKALHAARKAKNEFGFGAQWAGQGAPLARAMPAAELVALLREEVARA